MVELQRDTIPKGIGRFCSIGLGLLSAQRRFLHAIMRFLIFAGYIALLAPTGPTI